MACFTDDLPESLTSRIPTELYDLFIFHLSSSEQALSTCSLVSHTWLPIAQSYMLTNARISSHRRAKSLQALLESPTLSPSFAPSIRSLSIYTSSRVDPTRFVPLLPSLNRIYISGVARFFPPSEGLPTAEWLTWFHATSQLTDLALGHVRLESLSEFAESLGQFGALKHVGLVGVSWLDSALASPIASPTPASTKFPNIESVLLGAESIHLVPYLLSRGVTGIKRVDLRVDSGRNRHDVLLKKEVEDIDNYTNLLAPGIEELDLYNCETVEQTTRGPLPPLPNLRTLHLHGVNILLPHPYSYSFLTTALTALTSSPHLHTITIDIYIDPLLTITESPTLPIHPSGWKDFQRILCTNPNFRNVRRVEVRWLVGDSRRGEMVMVDVEGLGFALGGGGGDGDEGKRSRLVMRLHEGLRKRGVRCEFSNGPLPRTSTLEPYWDYERWFDRS